MLATRDLSTRHWQSRGASLPVSKSARWSPLLGASAPTIKCDARTAKALLAKAVAA
jgi:hypothetical protein